jgi:hypothetical protein
MLSTHLHLGLPSGLFSSGFLTNSLCAVLLSPFVLHTLHVIVLVFTIPIIIGEDYKSCSSSLCRALHPPVMSSLIALNILLNSVSSLAVRDPVTHTYRTIGKTMVLYIQFYITTSKIHNSNCVICVIVGRISDGEIEIFFLCRWLLILKKCLRKLAKERPCLMANHVP